MRLIFTFNNEINGSIHLGFYQYYRGYYNTGTNDDKTFAELRARLGGFVCGAGEDKLICEEGIFYCVHSLHYLNTLL